MDQPDFFTAWTEPESAANSQYQPVYPYNNATQTPSGHSFELDDTPTRERVRLQHRSGTFIEMHPNGDEVHKVYGDGYEITISNKNLLVQGRMKIEVLGDCEIHVAGDLIEQVDGNVEQHIKGNYTQVVEGISSLTSQGDTVINAGGDTTGGLKINTPDYMHISGDFTVDGELVAGKITSTGRIDAMDGMSAGLSGFVTVLGGFSAGIPIATPGSVTAVAEVAAPLGTFGVMSAVWAFDTVNLNLHNSHIHVSPKGPTGPPVPEEIGV
jgi:hypothetical protein